MIKIEADSLEEAYAQAAQQLNCSITEIDVEVIQQPGRGLRQKLFKKSAIIVASCKMTPDTQKQTPPVEDVLPETPVTISKAEVEAKDEATDEGEQAKGFEIAPVKAFKKETAKAKSFIKEKISQISSLNETILPQTFVTDQEEPEPARKRHDYAEHSSVTESFFEDRPSIEEISVEVGTKINALFERTCFQIDAINVSVYDDSTLLIEFGGDDAALLIGKEGYRYKALSYMLFNWINASYQVQLRLEIAEFLKNQEESVQRYLIGVYENIDRDGKAQTKILDGVLVQIALRELRSRYADKYVAIRSTRDGAKYIIINGYNEH